MLIPESVLQEVSDRLSIIEIISLYMTLQKRGGRFWGLCPFHNEKTPSFTILPDETGFYCFGCHKGGSIFTFIQEVENFTFPEAVEFLAEKAGVEIQRERDDEGSRRRKAYLELHNRIAGSFHYLLLDSESGESARAYLEKRGIDKNMTEVFNLGYAPADRRWLHRFLRDKNYSSEFLESSGLFSQRQAQTTLFSDRLMFPICNQRGETIAFGGRALGDFQPKYLNSPDTFVFSKRNNLYGLHLALSEIRKLRTFLLVEGYIDVLALHRSGIKYCVAPLGTSLTETQLRVLRRYADRGILLFDGDDAGIAAAERSVGLCEKTGFDCEVIVLPAGKDPADIVEEGGAQALHNLLKSSINGFTFLLNNALRSINVTKAAEKERALRQLQPYIGLVQSDVRKDAYLSQIADALQVERLSVQKDLARLTRNQYTRAPAVEELGDMRISNDLFLMLAVVSNRELYGEVRKRITADDLDDDRARQVFLALEDCYRNKEHALDALLTKIDDNNLTDLLLKKIATDEFSTNVDRLIQESIATIRERSLKRQRETILRQLKKLETTSKRSDEIQKLLEEKMYVDAELEKIKGSRR